MRPFTLLLAFALVLISAIFVIPNGTATADPLASEAEEPALEFSFPLHDGRVDVRDVLGKISADFGLPQNERLQQLDWTLDVRSAIGRLQLQALEQMSDGVLTTAVQHDRLVVRLDRKALRAKLIEAGEHAQDLLHGKQPNNQTVTQPSYGLTLLPAPSSADAAVPKHAVVLVHGMDDPGVMWGNLIPELNVAGYRIARFEYPNDGPIADATDLLAASLEQARRDGLERVDIVAHSMGGLVVRDLLTRSAYYGGDGTGGERFPAIDKFIMVGTPNHGSHLVRLRVFAELTEQLFRVMAGETISLSSSADGRGEAGVDLLPDSDFLRRLNRRPNASHTQHTVIAARLIPVQPKDAVNVASHIERLAKRSDAPQWLRELATKDNQQLVASAVQHAVNGLGDGCVTLESAKLDGVDDYVVVWGHHVSMLANLGMAKSTPPAVPIIMDRLNAKPTG